MDALWWMVFGVGAWEMVKWAFARLDEMEAAQQNPELVEQNLLRKEGCDDHY